MSYKTELINNNTDLQELINKANNLPEIPVIEKPTISVTSDGLITATTGKVSSTKQLSSFEDADFISDNIKKGVNIFGIEGNLLAGFEEFMQTITASGTFTVPATGKYRITAIGSGSQAKYKTSSTDWFVGCCGGGGYIEMDMTKGATYTATINGYAQLADSSGTILIKATAASGPTNSAAGTSGTVSGTGVAAFSSNGKSNQQSITPPACYNNPIFISAGGEGGYANDLSEDNYTQGYSGGSGLFGGTGGMGGCGGSDAMNTSSYDGFDGPGGVGGVGAGKGGTGVGGHYSAGASGAYQHAGGGGGGGYGGGGGRSTTFSYYWSMQRYEYGNGGQGGAACLFIHRIG